MTYLIFITFYSFSEEKDKYVSVETLAEQGQLNIDILSLGGHSGYCISIDLNNNTQDSLFIWLEAGRRFYSEDSSQQDILIVKEQKIKLKPFASKVIKAFGFCCQSHNSSPSLNSKFNIGKMADPKLVKLAQTINENDFPISSIQHAIWVISDNHPFSSVYSENVEDIVLLKETLSEVTGIQIPWYTIKYLKDPNALFSNQAESLHGKLEFNFSRSAILTIVVNHVDGIMSKTLVNAPYDQGEYSFDLNLDIKGWPKGDYTILVTEDLGRIKLIKKFKI